MSKVILDVRMSVQSLALRLYSYNMQKQTKPRCSHMIHGAINGMKESSKN